MQLDLIVFVTCDLLLIVSRLPIFPACFVALLICPSCDKKVFFSTHLNAPTIQHGLCFVLISIWLGVSVDCFLMSIFMLHLNCWTANAPLSSSYPFTLPTLLRGLQLQHILIWYLNIRPQIMPWWLRQRSASLPTARARISSRAFF